MARRLRVIQKFRRLRLPFQVLVILVLAIFVGSTVYAGLGGFTNPPPTVNLNQGLMAWYQLDGNAFDSSIYNNTGTMTGVSATTDRSGGVSGASTFNGTSDYIDLGNPSQLQITGSETITMWLKPDNFSSRRNPYAKAYGGEGTITQETNGALNYYYGTAGANGSPYQGFGTGSTLPLNQWSMVTIVRDVATLKLTWYINGAQSSQGTASYATATASSLNALIGKGYAGNYSGGIDDVRVYTRALNTAEISALYSGTDNQGKVNISNTQKGLKGWWKFDGDTEDSTPYYNHGTAAGGFGFGADRLSGANKAGSFNGTDSQVTLGAGTTSQVNFSNASTFTISAWINPSTTTGIQPIVAGQRSTSLFFGLDNSTLRLALDDGFMNSSATIPANQWTHVTAYFDSNTQTTSFYVNGSFTNSASYTDVNGAGNPATIYVGYESRFGYRYSGLIDDVRLYNYQLDTNSIKNLAETYDANVSVSSLQKGLVGYWSLNGDTKDSTPYANNGAAGGTATLTSDRRGRANSAYAFTSATGNIILSHTSLPANAITVSGWVKLNNHKNWNNIMNHDWVGSGWLLYVAADGKPRFGIGQSGTQYNSLYGTAINTGQWYHIAGVYDGTSVTVYVNGVAGNPNSGAPGATLDTTGNLFLGQSGASAYVDGAIDDLRIYNRPLSQPEIQRLYESY